MEKYAWKFCWNFRRGGDVTGLLVATEKEIENSEGKYVYFGEIRGKHSEVYGNISKSDFTKLDISPSAVEEVSKELGNSWSGYNPFDYIHTSCDHCGDSMSPDEWDCIYREDLDETVCYECYVEFKKEEL